MRTFERVLRILFHGTVVLAGLAAATLALLAATHAGPFRAAIDPETGTAGLLVERDAGTGCEYIVTPWGGIVPRTGANGRQICKAAP